MPDPTPPADRRPLPGTGPSGLDRLEELRDRPGTMGDGARVILVADRRPLLHRGEPVLPTWSEVRGCPGVSDPVLLGERDGVRFAAVAADADAAAGLEARFGGAFQGLRGAAADLQDEQAGMLFYAVGILSWHERSRRCARCGSPARSAHSGHRRVCTDPGCGEVAFPRTDPAIITLIRHGERALLVHQPRWPAGRFSTLAGFVEPGETLEHAVAREVLEEVGLPTERTAYFASQPWPFPHSLMIGFRTWAAGSRIRLGDELDDARWFTRQELRDEIAASRITLPGTYALSRALIDDWLADKD